VPQWLPADEPYLICFRDMETAQRLLNDPVMQPGLAKHPQPQNWRPLRLTLREWIAALGSFVVRGAIHGAVFIGRETSLARSVEDLATGSPEQMEAKLANIFKHEDMG
jgi:hypothetical protein